ncbi:MAG TPA: isoprenylcysteine carboxylmethyltransferase family protein [bacterium]
MTSGAAADLGGVPSPRPLPPSCTNSCVSAAGLAGFAAVLAALRHAPGVDGVAGALAAVAALAIPIAVIDAAWLKVWRRPSSGLDPSIRRPVAWRRVWIKLLGLYATVAVIAAAYWIFPEYRRPFYGPYWMMWRALLGPFLLCAIPYVIWVDGMMREPADGYWHAGLAAAGRWDACDRRRLRQHALGWMVKAFFLPLMFVYLVQQVHAVRHLDLSRVWSDFGVLFNVLWQWMFAVDVVLAVAGYLFTLRVFDTHIRSTDPTLFGWAVALVCYEPFWNFTSSRYLWTDDGYGWNAWLAGHPVLYLCWGTAILCCLGVYVWATVPFGLRFSNVTHRGILTNGPYRFTKHPAYVGKNLLWWLAYVPFVPVLGAAEAVRGSLMLFALNVVYYLRAKTEERHLSRDPVYVEYAVAMNDRSVFGGLTRLLPFLRYTPPQHPPTIEVG